MRGCKGVDCGGNRGRLLALEGVKGLRSLRGGWRVDRQSGDVSMLGEGASH